MGSLDRPNALAAHIDSHLMQIENDDFDLEDSYKAHSPSLMQNIKGWTRKRYIADSCTHLNPEQRE